MLFAFAIAAAVGQAAAPVPPPDGNAGQARSPSSATLWKGLAYGMSAEEAAANLRSVEGIRRVDIKYKKKIPRLTVSYVADGVDIGPSKAVVETSFEANGLTEVRLKTDECASAAFPKAQTIAEALNEKYASSAREKVVDVSGQPIGFNFAFWDDVTRVRMSFADYNPAIGQASIPGIGAAGAIADIFGAIASNAAERACPEDGGARVVTTITYLSQAAFLAEQRGFDADKEKIRRKAADGL